MYPSNVGMIQWSQRNYLNATQTIALHLTFFKSLKWCLIHKFTTWAWPSKERKQVFQEDNYWIPNLEKTFNDQPFWHIHPTKKLLEKDVENKLHIFMNPWLQMIYRWIMLHWIITHIVWTNVCWYSFLFTLMQ